MVLHDDCVSQHRVRLREFRLQFDGPFKQSDRFGLFRHIEGVDKSIPAHKALICVKIFERRPERAPQLVVSLPADNRVGNRRDDGVQFLRNLLFGDLELIGPYMIF